MIKRELILPTFEEAENMQSFVICKFGSYRLLMCPSEESYVDDGWIGIDIDESCELYHWEGANENNYLEACFKCQQLFFDEVED